jgi:phosphoribosylformimino-5-aminoimidazole carboxamide ribonucleotide (ProFAR) isomerase
MSGGIGMTHDLWVIATTIVCYSAILGAAFMSWAIKEGEASRKRRAEESQSEMP